MSAVRRRLPEGWLSATTWRSSDAPLNSKRLSRFVRMGWDGDVPPAAVERNGYSVRCRKMKMMSSTTTVAIMNKPPPFAGRMTGKAKGEDELMERAMAEKRRERAKGRVGLCELH